MRSWFAPLREEATPGSDLLRRMGRWWSLLVGEARDEGAARERGTQAVLPTLTPLAANRFELKYWVPESFATELLDYARPYLMDDPYYVNHGAPNGQWITSLYLDSQERHCLRAHVDCSPDRFKLRVRTYGDGARAFLEIKRKVNNVVVKGRTMLPLDEVPTLLEGRYDVLPKVRTEKERVNLETFLCLQSLYRLEPYLLAQGHREAYVSLDPADDVRLTLDRTVRCQPAVGASFDHDEHGWMRVDTQEEHGQVGDHVLVELKFPHFAPAWMKGLVDRMNLWRVGYSKFVSSARRIGRQRGDDLDLWDSAHRENP